MTGRRDDIRGGLGPGTPDDLVGLSERLRDQRPLPAAAFRGALRRRLVALRPPRPRPDRLGVLIARYAAAGGVLLLAGALSAAGLGPLAA
jgi:hypothetical protein